MEMRTGTSVNRKKVLNVSGTLSLCLCCVRSETMMLLNVLVQVAVQMKWLLSNDIMGVAPLLSCT